MGCVKTSNTEIIQGFQNKVLRNTVNPPWYIQNEDLHRDLQIETVAGKIKKMARKHEVQLHDHLNIEAIQVLDNSEVIWRLKRRKSLNLV